MVADITVVRDIASRISASTAAGVTAHVMIQLYYINNLNCYHFRISSLILPLYTLDDSTLGNLVGISCGIIIIIIINWNPQCKAGRE